MTRHLPEPIFRIATPSRRAKILKLAAEGETIKGICELAGLSTSQLRKWRQQDEEFDAEFKEAYEDGAHSIEDEIDRRGRKGVLEPIFHDGRVCGYKRRYSDQLLIAQAKARIPAYRDPESSLNVHLDFSGFADRLKAKLAQVIDQDSTPSLPRLPDK
jgi:hypothetical protein